MKDMNTDYSDLNNISISQNKTFGISIDLRLELKSINNKKNIILAIQIQSKDFISINHNRSAKEEAIFYKEILRILNNQYKTKFDINIYLVILRTFYYPNDNKFMTKLMELLGNDWKQLIFIDNNIDNIIAPFYEP